MKHIYLILPLTLLLAGCPSKIKSHEFHSKLTFDEMRAVGQIIIDLKGRTNDEDNHINFALADWINQAEEWFGPKWEFVWRYLQNRRHLIPALFVTATKTKSLPNGSIRY